MLEEFGQALLEEFGQALLEEFGQGLFPFKIESQCYETDLGP